MLPSSGKKAPNLLDAFGAFLPEDGNRAGFRKLEDEKSPPSDQKKETVSGSHTCIVEIPYVSLTRGLSARCRLLSLHLIFVVPCIMLYSGEISPTRCNNCVFYSQLLYMFRVTISPIIRSTMLYMATGALAHLGCY